MKTHYKLGWSIPLSDPPSYCYVERSKSREFSVWLGIGSSRKQLIKNGFGFLTLKQAKRLRDQLNGIIADYEIERGPK